MMNDYNELVAELREIERYGESMVDGYDAGLYADAIEQLVKERDAAVADLGNVLEKRIITMDDSCNICVGTHDMCDTCFLGNRWAWRGVKEDNDEID